MYTISKNLIDSKTSENNAQNIDLYLIGLHLLQLERVKKYIYGTLKT